MNSPIAALLVVSALFATAWVRDEPAHHPDRRVAMRAFIEPEVLAEARRSKRKAENIADSARVQRVPAGERSIGTTDHSTPSIVVDGVVSQQNTEAVEIVTGEVFDSYRGAVKQVNAIVSANWGSRFDGGSSPAEPARRS